MASPAPTCPQVCLVGGGRVALRLGARTLELDEDALEALVKSGGVEGALAELHVRGRAHAPVSAVSDEHPWLPLIIGEYVVTGTIGRGSYGVVVRALDRTTHERLAIKLLHVDDPASRQSLKNELRYLADLAHPGLVTADELLEVGRSDALVMPFIAGRDLGRALAEAAGAAGRLADAGRVRALVVQLLDALRALHGSDLVHMDLKPSNVLVDAADGVHLLDFGLSRLHSRTELSDDASGTPLYMAPELLLGEPVTPAVDLYALGVVLHEAIAGAHPFQGALPDRVFARLNQPAPPLASRRPGLDPEWAAIVDGLLEAAPERRPTIDGLLAALDAPRDRPSLLPFIGRQSELARLRARWTDAVRGVPALVRVAGEPGIGKSEVVRHFARELAKAGDAQIAWGRCHERDATPYRGVDAAIEQLGELLRADRRRASEAAALGGFAALARIFPGLALDDAADEGPSGRPDDALVGVVELLSRERPLLLVIEDAHWGDADSAELLLTLLASPALRRVVVLLISRGEEAWQRSPFGATIEASLARGLSLTTETITVGGLTDDESRELIRAAAVVDPPRLDALVARANGDPARLQTYARGLARGVAAGDLDALLSRRLAALSPAVLGLLERLIVAGRALPARVLAAAGAELPTRPELRGLIAERLVEVRTLASVRVMTLGHDMLQGASLVEIPTERMKALRRELAAALAAIGDDAAGVAELLTAADAASEAHPWALLAADEAEAARAFARAAELLGLALPGAEGDARPLRRRRAQLLIAAGRCREGAALLLEAVDSDPGDGALARADRRRAAEALMISGEIERGLEVLAPILQALELPAPALGLRGAVRLIGQIVPALLRDPSAHPSADKDLVAAERAEVCWATGKTLAFSEPFLGLELCLRAIHHARASGERRRLAPPMGFLAATLLVQVALVRGVGERWLAQIEAWAAEDPALTPLVPLYGGLYALSRGDLIGARDESRRALDLLGELPWERSIAASCLARALRCQGDFIACTELTRSHDRDAERRGDLYVQVIMRDYASLATIARGELVEARARLAWIGATWQPGRYTVQRAYIELYEAYAELYEGRGAAAAARLLADAPAFREAGGERIAFGRIDRRLALARIAVALGDDAPRALPKAKRLIGQLRAEGWPEAVGNADLLAAALLRRARADAEAAAALERARATFEAAEIVMEAAAVRLRLAELAGDHPAAEDARAAMRRLGASDPDRWAAVIAPGFDA